MKMDRNNSHHNKETLCLTKDVQQKSRKISFFSNKQLIVPCIANLSAAYNLTVIDYAMIFMSGRYPIDDSRTISLVASCSFFGSICGQLLFGYIGGCLGRRMGMILTLSLTVFGTICSSLLPYGSSSNVYLILSICRFIVGLGVGGVYPLSATAAVENTDISSCFPSKDIQTAFVFSFQGWGHLLAPSVTFLLTHLSNINVDIQWRLLLFLGSIPGCCVLHDAITSKETQEFLQTQNLSSSSSSSSFDLSLWSYLKEKKNWKKIISTTTCWFCFDLSFYGNIIFAPIVLAEVFQFQKHDLMDMSFYAILIAFIALCGLYTCVFSLSYLTYRTIQMQGFLIMSICFFVLSTGYSFLLETKTILFILYACTFFFSNYGPNVTTFAIPPNVFPSYVRVELNGIAAACGKLGAAFGVAIFQPMEEEYGIEYVLFLCGLVSLIGLLISHHFLQEHDFIPSFSYTIVSIQNNNPTINNSL